MEDIPGIPLIRMHQDGRNRSEHSRIPSDSRERRYVLRLNEESVHQGRDDSVRALNLLIEADLPFGDIINRDIPWSVTLPTSKKPFAYSSPFFNSIQNRSKKGEKKIPHLRLAIP